MDLIHFLHTWLTISSMEAVKMPDIENGFNNSDMA